MRWNTFLGWAGTAPTALLLSLAPAAADSSYDKWHYDKEKDRYTCAYNYDAKDGGTGVNTVLYYPKTSPRTGWYYYANAEGKIWARCACPGNDRYKPKVMYWQSYDMQADKFYDYDQKGYCPTPKGGKDPIPASIPDPPIQD